MADEVMDMNGSDYDGDIPAPPVDVSEVTRDRLRLAVCAIGCTRPPEEIAEHLAIGNWPDVVRTELARPLVLEEMDAYVDVLLTAIQAPVAASAAA